MNFMRFENGEKVRKTWNLNLITPVKFLRFIKVIQILRFKRFARMELIWDLWSIMQQ